MTRIVTSRTFRSGDSEAVRLPEEFAFGEGVEVEIVKNGDSLTIRRKPQYSGRDLVEALEKLPKPKHRQAREPIEFPERPGL
jgi:antitoxin VapB